MIDPNPNPGARTTPLRFNLSMLPRSIACPTVFIMLVVVHHACWLIDHDVTLTTTNSPLTINTNRKTP